MEKSRDATVVRAIILRMPRRNQIPSELAASFDRRAAIDAGIGIGRLRSDDINRPFHGVHTSGAPEDTASRCHAYLVRLKAGEVFSHVTAAQLHGLPLPGRFERQAAVDVTAVHPASAPTARHVIGHRLRHTPQTVWLDDLPVCTREETWCQLATSLSLEDLVVIADVLMNILAEEETDARSLMEAAAAKPGRSFGGKLLVALNAARRGSASPGESRVRFLLEQAGIPHARLNWPVTDASGRILGRGDLVWLAERVVLEYEGDQHREQDQFRYDVERYEAFRDAGWLVVRVTADHLRPTNRDALVARVRGHLTGN